MGEPEELHLEPHLEPEELDQQLGIATKDTQPFEEPLEELTKLLSGLGFENAHEDVAETTVADAYENILETGITHPVLEDLKLSVWPESPAALSWKEASLDW